MQHSSSATLLMWRRARKCCIPTEEVGLPPVYHCRLFQLEPVLPLMPFPAACFYRLKDLPFAIADYEEAMTLVPWDWSVRTQLAVAHCDAGVEAFRSKQAPNALKHFTRAIECNPKVSRFYICRATLRHLRQVQRSICAGHAGSCHVLVSSSRMRWVHKGTSFVP